MALLLMVPTPVKPNGVGDEKTGMGNRVLVGRTVSVARGRGVPPIPIPSKGVASVTSRVGTATGVPVSVLTIAMVGAWGNAVAEALEVALGAGVFDGPTVGSKVGDGRRVLVGVLLGVGLTVGELVTVALAVRVKVGVEVRVAVCVRVLVSEGVRVAVNVGVVVRDGVRVALAVGVAVALALGVCDGVWVAVDVAVAVGVSVAVLVGLGVAVEVSVGVRVLVALAVVVADGVKVKVGVGVDEGVEVSEGVRVGVSVQSRAISVSFMVGEGCTVGVRSTLGVTSQAAKPSINPPIIAPKSQPRCMFCPFRRSHCTPNRVSVGQTPL